MSLQRLFMVLPSCTISAILGVFHTNKRVNECAHGFLGCPQVGYSLMGLMGSASMMVTITVFCGAADGIDDDISVRLHSRSLVCTDGLDTLIPTKPRTPISCATPEPPAS
ncbi:putative secreted protein [Corynebacterium diphtheriae bv. mitis]|nr:hypothetical protein CDPW8_2223 [Corynebacterium diphtheriae PW8]CAB0620920.1 hypothetical protein CIP107554_02227 [Corynebacterium diphtheriae]SUY76694.1 putative secreted protein [Corynebacterium diphtheriae bv. mitis]